MGRPIRDSYYEDNYIKYECQSCKRCFILGETLSDGMNLTCPYCKSPEIESVAAATEESTEDMDLGCLGIYYSLYNDGSLMLYTEHEFAQALANNGGTALDTVTDSIKRYCAKRDGRDNGQ